MKSLTTATKRLQFHFYFSPNYSSSLQLAHPSNPLFLVRLLSPLPACLSQFVRPCTAAYHLCSACFVKGKCPALPNSMQYIFGFRLLYPLSMHFETLELYAVTVCSLEVSVGRFNSYAI